MPSSVDHHPPDERPSLRRPLPARRPRLPDRARRQVHDDARGAGPARPGRRRARRGPQPAPILLDALTADAAGADVRPVGRGIPDEAGSTLPPRPRQEVGFHLNALTALRRPRPRTRSHSPTCRRGSRRSKMNPASVRRTWRRFARCSTTPASTRTRHATPASRLPRRSATIVEPPTAREVDAIIANVPARFRLPLRVLEQTGMRVGELHALEWRDVDEAGVRFRVRHGKTRQPAGGSRCRTG